MRIATYNIHRAVGQDGRRAPWRIQRVIEELDVDVLALQEVGYRPDRRGHLLEVLGEAMKAEVIEGITLRDERGHYGNAVLTRLPVRRAHRHDISFGQREPRGAIELVLEPKQTELQVVATHLGLRPRERRHQVTRLRKLIEASEAPVKILLGDLNEWFLWGRPLRSLGRMFASRGAPATFPARRPILALDRVWVAPSRMLRRLYVHQSDMARIASDHLPLVAELDLTAR